MRRFALMRHVDMTGVSGTGVVAHGVQFGDGSCVMRWLTETRSTSYYDSIDDIKHIHGHEGSTGVTWIDA